MIHEFVSLLKTLMASFIFFLMVFMAIGNLSEASGESFDLQVELLKLSKSQKYGLFEVIGSEELTTTSSLMLHNEDGNAVASIRPLKLGDRIKARILRVYRPDEFEAGAILLSSLGRSGLAIQKNREERLRERGIVARDSIKTSARMRRRGGLEITAGHAMPFLGLIGFQYGYNFSDFSRLSLSYGITPSPLLSIHSFNVGTKFMVPNWNLSPFIGIYISGVLVNVDDEALETIDELGSGINQSVGGGDINVIDDNQFLPFIVANFGVDWQMESGLQMSITVSPLVSVFSLNGSGSVESEGFLLSLSVGTYLESEEDSSRRLWR